MKQFAWYPVGDHADFQEFCWDVECVLRHALAGVDESLSMARLLELVGLDDDHVHRRAVGSVMPWIGWMRHGKGAFYPPGRNPESRGPRRVIDTATVREKLKLMWESGERVVDIAKVIGCSAGRVSQLAREMGLRSRFRGGGWTSTRSCTHCGGPVGSARRTCSAECLQARTQLCDC